MKKIYLSLVIASALSTAMAQKAERPNLSQEFTTVDNSVTNNLVYPKAGIEIWNNDFDTPAEWVIDNDGQTGPTFGWTIDAVSDSWYSASGINSTSGGNFAEVSNGNPTLSPGTQAFPVLYTMTLAAPIDIPNLPLNTGNTDLVTLQFEQYGAHFYDAQEIQISTDGVVWTTVGDNSAVPMLTSTGGSAYPNPDLKMINLAPFIAGNANSVWLRFSWTSEFPTEVNPNAWVTYGWFIDDVKIFTNPANDLDLQAVWISGENNGGSEYGRNPADQLDANWAIGGLVYNNGTATQNNLVLAADFTSFTASATHPFLATLDDTIVETIDPLTLVPGLYTGNYTVISDEEMGGLEFANNVGSRMFEVTPATTSPNSVYSLDGIGVYTSPLVGSYGTPSFGVDSQDGFICATRYHIKNTALVSGIRVMLASGTVAGGEIYGSIKDTTTFWLNDMTSLYNTVPVTVTTANVTAGYVNLWFAAPISLNVGAYYAAAELFSNGGTTHIRVRDDETVAQPGDASAIYIPGDQSWGNGTAFGIRLLMGDTWGVGVDENTLTGVTVYPNPSEGIVEITSDYAASTIIVYDMLGNVILTKEANGNSTIDLSSNGTGIYMVKVSTANGSMVERVVIK